MGVGVTAKTFTPEFINRLDKIVVFKLLGGRDWRLFQCLGRGQPAKSTADDDHYRKMVAHTDEEAR